MSRLVWDANGDRKYETGLDHGVLYLLGSNNAYQTGVPWNGLISITESPSGGDANPLYADNIKYLNLIAAEDFGASIEAYSYPAEFAQCDGTVCVIPGLYLGQQTRKTFGLSYRTLIGNDINGTEYGYKILLIYGAMASPSDRGYQTVNDSPEAISFSWNITTTPTDVPDFKPTAHLAIDSTQISAELLALLEDLIWGKDEVEGTPLIEPEDAIEPMLPSPAAILYLIENGTYFREEDEVLCDSSGESIQDDTGDDIEARVMVIVA